MSTVHNNDGMQAGCIYRIALENFVTYKRVELFPGPSLNLIIGPNGTGKSTFVCAIILGLCGKPEVIGRAKKISDYVRSGCQNSTIEIELYRDPCERNVVITRNFNLSDQSSWSIDHRTVRESQVQELIASMNIQVDNLCQLLPQDRVQDFSKMNPQQLLRSTLSAVGKVESVRQLDQLIDWRKQHRENSSSVESKLKTIEENERQNERQKVIIDAMKERRQLETVIELCEKKLLWVEYQDLREKFNEYKTDKQRATERVNVRRNEIKPLEQVIGKAKRDITQIEQKTLESNKGIFALKDVVDKSLNSIREKEYELKKIEEAFQNKLERHNNREREIQENKAILEKLNLDKTRLVATVGDETKVKMETVELDRSLNKTKAAIEIIKTKKLQLQHDMANDVAKIRSCENRLRTLEDVNIKRLEALRNYSEDSYKALMWLRQNRNLFKYPVHEPMMLEINFSNPKFARYLENTVSQRDLVAFTFESPQDMNLFLKKVRQEQGFKRANAVCSPEEHIERNNDIQQYSYLGFYTYIVDTLTAPDAILRYLCRKYHIHKIPIGNDHTYKNSGKVPAHIRNYFTENHRFVVRVSSYSGEKSISTSEIRQARLLANTVDDEQISRINTELRELQEIEQSKKNEKNTLESKLTTLEGNLQAFNSKRRTINEGVEKVRTISAQIRIQFKKVQSLAMEPTFDIEEEKKRCRRKQKDCVLKQLNLQTELKDTVTQLHTRIHDGKLLKIKLDIYRNAIVDQETLLRDMQNELKTVENTLEEIRSAMKRVNLAAREKLQEAQRSCNNKMADDPDFPYKKDFETLPNDVNGLEEQCLLLKSKIECMDQGDEHVIREYEDRKKLIHKLKAELRNSSNSKKELEKKMNETKSQWLPRLLELLKDVDRNFGDMFSKLKCAGEIKLEQGESEDDYDKYGISIMVRFRDSEELQQLTRFVQSGGERALSTALYLMALQGLTTVPFRCVDEINQGMDHINERKMFELLVKVTTECERAQYFLLTPKLLSKMQYNDKIMVQTIMNGANIMKNREWKYDAFLERARAYKHS